MGEIELITDQLKKLKEGKLSPEEKKNVRNSITAEQLKEFINANKAKAAGGANGVSGVNKNGKSSAADVKAQKSLIDLAKSLGIKLNADQSKKLKEGKLSPEEMKKLRNSITAEQLKALDNANKAKAAGGANGVSGENKNGKSSASDANAQKALIDLAKSLGIKLNTNQLKKIEGSKIITRRNEET